MFLKFVKSIQWMGFLKVLNLFCYSLSIKEFSSLHARSIVILHISSNSRRMNKNLENEIKLKFMFNFNVEIYLFESLENVCQLISHISVKVSYLFY
jgi:hypothetical protein